MTYHAEIRMGVGGSWARDDDRETAIERCIEIAFRDWRPLFQMDGEKVPVNVTNMETDELEVVERVFPVRWIASESELDRLICGVACLPRLAPRMSDAWLDEAYEGIVDEAEEKARDTRRVLESGQSNKTMITLRQVSFLESLIDESKEAIEREGNEADPIL